MPLKPRFIQQDIQFEKLRDEQTAVTVMLTGGLKLHGRIESFDQYVVTLMDDVPQMVFKHAIAFVQPQRAHAQPKQTRAADHSISHERSVSRERSESRELSEPRHYSSPSLPAATKTPVIVRKKLRTIAPTSDDLTK